MEPGREGFNGEFNCGSRLLPWWKIVIYMASFVLAVITIKVTITFNLNDWLRGRKEAKDLKERGKVIGECPHVWTLYADNPYSRCDLCLVLISTSLLLVAIERGDPLPLISGELRGMIMKPGRKEIVTRNYIGAKIKNEPQ